MATEKQIQANRRNAMASTGPKTPQGKERVSQNAVTHGLTATSVVLRGEDGAEYEKLRMDALALYKPKGAMEERKVDELVSYDWRSERLDRAERALHHRLQTREAGRRAFDIESRGIFIGEKLHMFDKETDAMILKEAKNIEPTAEDIESALVAMLMDGDAMKASRVIDARRQAILRGRAQCLKEFKAMQKRRRKNEERDEPPPPIPFRNGPRRSIAQDDD